MIKLNNVTKFYYSSTGASLGLRKINLEIPTNTGLIAITGESGSGKSTILNVISCLDTYEEGEVIIDGQDTSALDENELEAFRKENIGFIYQNYNLIDSYTVLENVISSMIIKDQPYKESKDKAIEIIKQVGLFKYINHKAANLSSGQKQRLSIARALAKDCKIVVADEPTGNLDSETGKQLISLLSEISKTRLVIVATHNYEDFKSYVNYFIRLYQGELSSFELVSPIIEEIPSNQSKIKKEKSYLTFTYLNLKNQPHRVFLNILLFSLCFLIILIMTGYFQANVDPSSTLIRTSEIFSNTNENRIIIRSENGFEKDKDSIKTTNHVIEIDSYDLANEVNYYYQEKIDYDYDYSYISETEFSGNAGSNGGKTVKFLRKNKFLRSVECISQDDLLVGTIPTKTNEILMYSEDISILNKTILFYFSQENALGNSHYSNEMKVVGLLKENKNQVYFSNLFMESMYFCCKYDMKLTTSGVKATKFNATTKTTTVRLICDSNLNSDSISLSKEKKEYSLDVFKTVYNRISLESKNLEISASMGVSSFETYSTDITYDVCLIGEDVYKYLFGEVVLKQMSIYIDDYAYIDEIISSFEERGYMVTSPYKNGSTTYDESKVVARLVTLGISSGSIIVVSFLLIVVSYVFLKLKKKDYSILKSMGLKNKYCYNIVLFELLLYGVLSYVICTVLFLSLAYSRVEYILSIFKYLRFYHFVFLFVYDMLLTYITSLLFKRYLSNKISVISLKED